jgi:hypothetical protein
MRPGEFGGRRDGAKLVEGEGKDEAVVVGGIFRGSLVVDLQFRQAEGQFQDLDGDVHLLLAFGTDRPHLLRRRPHAQTAIVLHREGEVGKVEPVRSDVESGLEEGLAGLRETANLELI